MGFGAALLVVACWLTAAFAAPGRLRDRAAWLGATSFYAALLCLFVSLFLRARADDSLAGTYGFGFLVAFFACGFVLASLRTLRALGAKDGRRVESATH